MAKLVDYVEELISEVGPRPVGTQQENDASEIIATRLEGFGLPVQVDEFVCTRTLAWVRALYLALAVIGAEMLVFVPFLHALGLILIVLSTLLLVLDLIDKNPLNRLFKNSLSQNVIARYLPSGAPSARTRRIVILAHYDSARASVQAAPLLVNNHRLIRLNIDGFVGLLFILAIFSIAPLPEIITPGLRILVGISGAVLLVAFLAEIVNFFMPYSQGANCNGSGVAVLYGIAQRLISGVSDTSGASDADRSEERRTRKSRRSREDSGERSGREGRRSGTGRSREAQGDESRPGGRGTGSRNSSDRGDRISSGTARERTRSFLNTEKADGLAFDDRSADAALGATAAQNTPYTESAKSGAKVGPAGSSRPTPTDSRIASVADNLVSSPFIAQRPPLAQIEEQRHREEEEERTREAEEQRRRQAENQGRGPDGTPAWFTKAREKAEKNKERKERTTEGHEVVRSRFADIPTHLDREEREERNTRSSTAMATRSTAAMATAAEDMAARTDANTPAADAATMTGAAATASATVTAATTATPHTAATAMADTAVALDKTGKTGASPANRVDNPLSDAQPEGTTPEEVGSPQQTRPPLSAQTDLTGFDRQAFKVLPAEDGSSATIVVPTTEDTLDTSDKPEHLDDHDFVSDDAAKTSSAGSRTAHPADSSPARPTIDPLAAQRLRLRDLPSVSGAFPVQQAALDAAPVATEDLFSDDSSPVSATGAFMPLGTTGMMKPIGEELLAYHDDEEEGEIFIADADDSGLTEEYSEAGNYTQTDVVDIPQSRVKSFFGSMGDRFSGRRREKLQSAPSTWLGVDEGFDARKEGSEIGSWDHFNDEDSESDAGWRGGAYGGESFEENVSDMMEASTGLLDKEVWLVALGAHESANAGVKHLLATYPTELRGALFINVCGVGIGDLCLTHSEGSLRTTSTDQRLQGLLAESGQALGIQLGQVDFRVFETDAHAVLSSGGRAISLIGLKKNTPASWHWSDDEAARLAEDNLQDATDLVIEAIKGA